MRFLLATFALLLVVTESFFQRRAAFVSARSFDEDDAGFGDAVEKLILLADHLGQQQEGEAHFRIKREDTDMGVTNLDIREAILQLLGVIRNGNTKFEQHSFKDKKLSEDILDRIDKMGGQRGTERKIDNISTFLLRMNAKLESIERRVKRGGGGRGGGSDILETLAQESFDILTLLPTYIENTKDAIAEMSEDSKRRFGDMERLLVDEEDGDGANGNGGERKSLAHVVRSTEANIMDMSRELRSVVIESGEMAESLFERVNEGYRDLTKEIRGLSNVEQVLLDTADSVMDTKRKVEFGVQQIIFKVGELVKISGGEMDNQLSSQFADITRTILSNQTEALGNLTKKLEKEIGQVWRQMGIMYGQVSSSINILEKVKEVTEGYVSNTGKNLGTMEGQVEGLNDRMVDVDSNLNYMLGQLSLVVQEFNQVKTGLNDAMSGLGDELEEIKEYDPNSAAAAEGG